MRGSIGTAAVIESVLAICIGASAGALLRWQLGLWLNALWPQVPPGTLAANVIGGYLVGVAVAFFAAHPQVPAHWRLLVITGFLGGLTTFSTFSAEVVSALQDGRLRDAVLTLLLHVSGSLLATIGGLATVRAFR